jgi:hypothetical protein
MVQNMMGQQVEDLKSKNPEQRAYIQKFFSFQGGCFKKPMLTSEYIAAVMAKKNSLNIKQKALSKLGIDPDEKFEIDPVEFTGWAYVGDYRSKDGCSSQFETTWIFFGETQLYVYSYMFDMTADNKRERTEEYFYKDVTNFSSTSETVETTEYFVKSCLGLMPLKIEQKKINVDTTKFSVIVPGDKFSCAMEGNSALEERIKGMKQKLREKKDQA